MTYTASIDKLVSRYKYEVSLESSSNPYYKRYTMEIKQDNGLIVETVHDNDLEELLLKADDFCENELKQLNHD